MKLQSSSIVMLSLCFVALAWPAHGQQPTTGNATPTGSPSTLSVHSPGATEDHFHLAQYFRDLAAREQALAKSYERIAKIYKAKTLPAGLDAAAAREMKNQYGRLAATERKAAEAATSLAAYHAHLADLVASLPGAEAKGPNPQDAAFRR